MANIEYTDDVYTGDLYANAANPEIPQARGAADADPAEKSTLGAAFNMLGAVASLALIAGVGVWGYKLIVRDVSGVPVVRALQGPMRIQPANPGGRQADHQGLAVNAVAAQGIAAPVADRLMLAPRPVQLADEDGPVVQIVAIPASMNTDVGDVETVTPAPTTAALDAYQAGSVEALAAQLTAGVQPLTGAAPATVDGAPAVMDQDADATLTPDAAAVAVPTIVEPAPDAIVQGPGLTRSLRPQARPARAVISSVNLDDGAVLAEAISSAVQTVASLDVDADSLPIGTRLAQLGAYDTPDIARGEWDKLNVRFEEVMESKKRVIQQASSGGRTFYRLRAMGFDDMNDARRFCSALMAENADCIPVTTR